MILLHGSWMTEINNIIIMINSMLDTCLYFSVSEVLLAFLDISIIQLRNKPVSSLLLLNFQLVCFCL